MNFSNEQLKIIKDDSTLLHINSFSGYAKTYTLIHKCLKAIKLHEHFQIIYIVNNQNSKHKVNNLFKKYIRKYFNKYKAKTKLTNIKVKTNFDIAYQNVKNQYGTFEIEEFNSQDIYDFLKINADTSFSKLLAIEIFNLLQNFYKNDDGISDMLKKELDDNLDNNQHNNITTLYEGAIKILQAQQNLDFKINTLACMKFFFMQNHSTKYIDMILIDDAQNTNTKIYKYFLSSKANFKILCGDSYKPTKQGNINTLVFKQYAQMLPLSTSYRITKEAKNICNSLLKKIDKKVSLLHFSEDINFDINNLNIDNSIYIFNTKINMLKSIIKNVQDNKTFYLNDDFSKVFDDFLAICSIKENTIEHITKDIQNKINIFLQLGKLENFIENNQNLLEYYNLYTLLKKNNIQIKQMVENLTSSQKDYENAKIRYSHIDDIECDEYDFVFIANDFIDFTKIHKPNKQEVYEIKKLYMAISRAKKAFHIFT